MTSDMRRALIWLSPIALVAVVVVGLMALNDAAIRRKEDRIAAAIHRVDMEALQRRVESARRLAESLKSLDDGWRYQLALRLAELDLGEAREMESAQTKADETAIVVKFQALRARAEQDIRLSIR